MPDFRSLAIEVAANRAPYLGLRVYDEGFWRLVEVLENSFRALARNLPVKGLP